MKMIWHDHPRVERRLGMEALYQNVSHLGTTKLTLAVARIEPLVPFFGEGGVELVLLIFGQLVNVGGLLQTMSCEPSIAFGLPFAEFFLGHGVSETSGDEVSDVVLPPVRQVSPMNVKLVVRAKESGFGFSRRVFVWSLG
jgi:hypothetical protein